MKKLFLLASAFFFAGAPAHAGYVCPKPNFLIEKIDDQLRTLGLECKFTATEDEFWRCVEVNSSFFDRYYSIQLDRGCVKRSKTRPYISHQWGGGVGWTTQVYGNVGNTTFVLRQYVMVMDPDKRKFVTDWKHQIRMMEREGWQGLSWR